MCDSGGNAYQLSGVVIVMGTCGSGKSSLGKYIAKQCEPKYLTCTIWLQVRTHRELSKQGHWNHISGMYKTLLQSKVHSQGHIDGCLLY